MKSIDELKNTPNLIIAVIGEDGGGGEIRYGKLVASVIWSFGGGWDHVSVAPYRSSYTPSWGEMCKVKDMFFNDDEIVVQYHPAKNEYVNNIPNCLHLWRPQNVEMPVPPSVMVGMRKGQTREEFLKEAEELLK